MGFLKKLREEKMREKEVETTGALMFQFKDEMKKINLEDADLDVQAIYDSCEEMLKKIESLLVICREDLAKSKKDLIDNTWWATRESLAQEHQQMKRRVEVAEREKANIISIRDKMVERGAKKSDNQVEASKQEQKQEEESEVQFGA